MANHSFLGLQSIGSMLQDNEPYVEWVAENMLPRGGLMFLVARPGAGKSLLAYYMVACVLTGSPIFEAISVIQGAVVYIDLDGRKGIAKMRAAAALRGLGLDDEEIAAMPLYIAAQRSSMDLRDLIILQAVLDELAAIPDLMLVVFDTYSDLHHGKEGSPDDMTDTVAGMMEIVTRFNCGGLAIHHARKNGGNELEDVRGASSIVAKADSVFLLKTEREDEDNPGKLTLLQRKARLTEEARPRNLLLEANGEVDGTLHAYRFSLADTQGRRGRPATVAAEAEKIITNLLWEEPAKPKPEAIKALIAAGIPKTTAYRVAGVKYSQKSPDPGVVPFMGNGVSPAPQRETPFPSTAPERAWEADSGSTAPHGTEADGGCHEDAPGSSDGSCDVVVAYRCLECGAIAEEPADDHLYECGACDTIFSEANAGGRPNQCPGCNRFATKLADVCCAACEQGEVEEIECRIVDGEYVPIEEVQEILGDHRDGDDAEGRSESSSRRATSRMVGERDLPHLFPDYGKAATDDD